MPAQATKKERKEKTIKLHNSHWTLKSFVVVFFDMHWIMGNCK